MPYKWLKFLILWIPTITIGLWEYIRHTFLLSYVSMDLGNFLAPVLVLVVSMTLLRGLFAKLEHTQEALQHERLMKASLEQREQLARELHDGISQSLFLLSVKMDRLEHAESKEEAEQTSEQIRGTIKHVYEDVRQSIANLQSAPVTADVSWMNTIHTLAEEMRLTSGIHVGLDWRLSDGMLTNKGKIELLAIISEALMNVRKHTHADQATVSCTEMTVDGERIFCCEIKDNGAGSTPGAFEAKGRYGIKMMRDRAERMGWHFEIHSGPGQGTSVAITNRRRPQ